MKQNKTQTIRTEYTDTFGGDANYSWVQRASFEVTDNAPESAIIRRAKKGHGLNGMPCRKVDLGGLIALYPRNSCTVLFVEI